MLRGRPRRRPCSLLIPRTDAPYNASRPCQGGDPVSIALPQPTPRLSDRACLLLAACLILLAAALRAAFLLLDCPLDLAPDEAHYWDWSRHLDWNYYSKGPLVAWIIGASCWLLGP